MATKKTTTTPSTTRGNNRSRPNIAKAGFTKTRRRYPDGGKVSKKV